MKNRPFLQKLITGVIAIVFLLGISLSAFAVDLPIDPEAITRQGETRQPALTSRWGIDLFSDSSREVSEAIVERREASRAEAQTTIFNDPISGERNEPETYIREAVREAGLFSEPVRFGNGVRHEADDIDIPIWIVIIIFIAAAALGLLIAVRSANRRKEKAQNVHHHNA